MEIRDLPKKIDYLIGIDEAGRGPLAGPVAIGMCVAPLQFDFSQIENIRDSKKLSEKGREDVFNALKKVPEIQYKVSFGSSSQIDKRGIERVIKSCINRLLKPYDPEECLVLLDGRLRAPDEFLYQETIIKGDDKEPVISLASICAKVLRDRKMLGYSKKYPDYEFERHKGYGTQLHRDRIKSIGVCEIHRNSFIH